MPSNREVEASLCERFQRLSGLFPPHAWMHAHPPEPDILIDCPTGRIGLEITRIFHRDDPRRIMEGEQDGVLERVTQRWLHSGLPLVDALVVWQQTAQIRKHERKGIVEALFTAGLKCLPEAGGRHWANEVNGCLELLPHQVGDFRMWRPKGIAATVWHSSRMSFVTTFDSTLVLETIRAKETKYLDYVGGCDALWLLLALEGLGPSSWFEVPDDILTTVYESKRFRRIFFMRATPETWFELTVAA